MIFEQNKEVVYLEMRKNIHILTVAKHKRILIQIKYAKLMNTLLVVEA